MTKSVLQVFDQVGPQLVFDVRVLHTLNEVGRPK